jgi:hypothetical protein
MTTIQGLENSLAWCQPDPEGARLDKSNMYQIFVVFDENIL